MLCILIGSEKLMSFWNCVVACTICYGSLMPRSPPILTQALFASLGQFYLPLFPVPFAANTKGSLALRLLGSLGWYSF